MAGDQVEREEQRGKIKNTCTCGWSAPAQQLWQVVDAGIARSNRAGVMIEWRRRGF
jgi:hypothetical protein